MKYRQKNFERRDSRDNFPRTPGLMVEVRNNDVNKALRKLKKKVQAEGILQEFKDRQYYTKPSEIKRRAKKAGKKRWLKKQREEAQVWGGPIHDKSYKHRD